jgi:hypothetical protein
MISEALSKELRAIEQNIAEFLQMDLDRLEFGYYKDGEKSVLNLVTISERHNQKFLFHRATGFGEMDVAMKMLDYVKNHRRIKNSYTIQWSLADEHELHTSYFRGKDIYDVLDKFYFGKDINSTIIFHLSLNPVA